MQLAAVIKARALGILDIGELNLTGKVRLADCVPQIVEKYGFLTFPAKAEDFDLDKGIHFGSGRSGQRVIDALVIYSGLIYVETLSSTSDSREVLEEILSWGQEVLGLTYVPGMIRRWAYISQLVFYTDFPLLATFSKPLESLARKTTEVVGDLFGEGLVYEPTGINVGHDPLARKHGIAGFVIQHRNNVRFADNKYFSEAPLPTEIHRKFLEEFESEVLASHQ